MVVEDVADCVEAQVECCLTLVVWPLGDSYQVSEKVTL